MHHSQASQQQPSSIQHITASGLPIYLDQRLREIRPSLRTTYESVYQVSRDGTHESPATLRGVPVAKLTEDSAYWDPSWSSLDAFLAQESDEAKEKIRSRNELKLNPTDKRLEKESKDRTDNMSKHKKIREIFGHDSPYHPNQLVRKRHMPREGLCQKEMMYRLACRVADFICLHKEGHLTMDPWDFFRWRFSIKLNERLQHPGDSAKEFLRTAVYRLCDQSQEGNRYDDPIMRDAVLISACFQNRFGAFNKTKIFKLIANGGQPVNPGRGIGNPRAPRPATLLPPRHPRHPTAAAVAAAQQRHQERQERRARNANSPLWQGVNHFLAQQHAIARPEGEQQEQGPPPQPRSRPRTQGGQTVRREPQAGDPETAANWPGLAAHRARIGAAERARLEREEHNEARRQVNEARRERQESAREGFRLAREEQDREARQARQRRQAGVSPDGDYGWLGRGGGNVFLQVVGRHARERDQNDAARERADRDRQARASESTLRGQEEIQRARRERRGYY